MFGSMCIHYLSADKRDFQAWWSMSESITVTERSVEEAAPVTRFGNAWSAERRGPSVRRRRGWNFGPTVVVSWAPSGQRDMAVSAWPGGSFKPLELLIIQLIFKNKKNKN